MSREIFVFGSNEAGKHGKGAAAYAVMHHGAVYNVGIGLQGNSYAIPTKNKNFRTLDLEKIKRYVDQFIWFSRNNTELIFMVTAIGCGLAGCKVSDIAPMFSDVPDNVILPKPFQLELRNEFYNKKGFEHTT